MRKLKFFIYINLFKIINIKELTKIKIKNLIFLKIKNQFEK